MTEGCTDSPRLILSSNSFQYYLSIDIPSI